MLRRTLISSLLTSALFITTALAQNSVRPLTNNDVVSFTKSGLPESTILTVIQAQNSGFDVSASEQLKLKEAGVSPRVMDAMLAAASKESIAQPTAAADAVAADPSPSASAPATPAKKKRSWLKALTSNAAVGQALVAAASEFTNGGPATGGIKNAILSRVSGIASGLLNGRQPDATNGNSLYLASDTGMPYAGGGVQSLYPAPVGAGPVLVNAPQGQLMMVQPLGVSDAAFGGTTEIVPRQEPSHGAFIMNVPQGWQVTGGVPPTTVLDSRQAVRLVLPDGQILLLLGNGNPGSQAVPDSARQPGRAPEGQTLKAATPHQ